MSKFVFCCFEGSVIFKMNHLIMKITPASCKVVLLFKVQVLLTPELLQIRLALCFSRIETVLGLLSSSMIVGGTENVR